MPRELPVTSTALSRRSGMSSVGVIDAYNTVVATRATIAGTFRRPAPAAKAENMAKRAAQRGGRRPAGRKGRPEAGTVPRAPIRLLTAVPICDGHDSAINTINLEFIRHGFEVVYLG